MPVAEEGTCAFSPPQEDKPDWKLGDMEIIVRWGCLLDFSSAKGEITR